MCFLPRDLLHVLPLDPRQHPLPILAANIREAMRIVEGELILRGEAARL